MATMHAGAWLGSWHDWIDGHEDELNKSNFFPLADDDTGTNLKMNTAPFRGWTSKTPDRTIELELAFFSPTGANSGLLLRHVVAGLHQVVERSGVVVDAADVAACFRELSRGLLFSTQVREAAAPAGLRLIATTLGDWPLDDGELERRVTRTLESSRSVNQKEWRQNAKPGAGPAPYDAGVVALVGLLECAVALLRSPLLDGIDRA